VTGPGDILYNTPVTVVDTSGIKPVAIDANGDYHYADAIIVCVSLGVLKAGIIDFIPDHSVEKQQAIDTIGMGRGMKIFLRFSSKFWPNFSYVYNDGPAQFCYRNEQV
jgi:monoamine oxidase